MEFLAERAVLRIDGDDARPFLQGLVTQDVLHVAPGEAVFAALLTPQGKILFDLFLTPAADGFLVDCRAEAAPAILKRLALYKLRARVSITEESLLGVAIGDNADAVASFSDPRHSRLPRRSIARRTVGAAKGDSRYEALRLDIGAPEFGADFDGEEVFPLDVNYDALNAVSYSKGCFVGQEVTSRMKRKGAARKRTMIARFDGPAPVKGTPVLAGDSPIGGMLSGRDGIALALIRLDRLEAARSDNRTLTADGRPLRIGIPAYLEQP